MRNLFFTSSLKCLPAPIDRFLFFLLDKRCISCLVYLFVISLSKISANSCNVILVNELKSSGFLNSDTYESKEIQEIDEFQII